MYVTYFVLTLPYNLQCIVISLQSLSVEFMWFRREIMRFLWLRFKVKANLLSHPIIHTHSLSSDTHTYTHLTQHPTSHCMHPKLPFSTTHIHTHTHTHYPIISGWKGKKNQYRQLSRASTILSKRSWINQVLWLLPFSCPEPNTFSFYRPRFMS